MKILWLYIFLIDRKFIIISSSKMNKIKNDLKDNGRYHVISTFLKERSSRNGSDIINKLIRKYRFPDKDYFELISKYGDKWVMNLLRANKWDDDIIDEYINILHKTFD